MRRTRYIATITTERGCEREIHVLDYTPGAARALLAERHPGWTIHSLLPAATHAKVQRGGAWHIDAAALREACDLLGIRGKVRVRLDGRYGRTNANHRYTIQGNHNIMVKSYLTVAQATESLWHELQHAAQAESSGDYAAWYAHVRQQQRYPYRIRPIEVEARATAELMADVPLTIKEG